MTGFFKGLATAMVTPFTKEGKFNRAAFAKMIEYQIAGGADALVILGTTGEPATMDADEKLEVMNAALEIAKKRVKLIFGTGSNDTKKAVENAKLAQRLGADGMLVVTPYYNKCTQQGLYLYYKAVCEAVTIPVIGYSVPSRTGVNMLPETVAKIAEIPNFAGIKEASGNMAQVCETARLIRGKCDLYSGEDPINLPILAVGGTGVISVVSNLAPALVKALYIAAEKGDFKKANEINDKLLPLAKACFCEVNPIPVKAGMNFLGFDAGEPRSPLTPLETAHEELLKNAMRSCGLEVRA